MFQSDLSVKKSSLCKQANPAVVIVGILSSKLHDKITKCVKVNPDLSQSEESGCALGLLGSSWLSIHC